MAPINPPKRTSPTGVPSAPPADTAPQPVEPSKPGSAAASPTSPVVASGPSIKSALDAQVVHLANLGASAIKSRVAKNLDKSAPSRELVDELLRQLNVPDLGGNHDIAEEASPGPGGTAGAEDDWKTPSPVRPDDAAAPGTSLSVPVQERLLALQQQAPDNGGLQRDLRALSGNRQFGGLNPTIQTTVVDAMGRLAEKEAARQTLAQTATLPGFQALSQADQDRMVRLLGANNELGASSRVAMRQFMTSSDPLGSAPAHEQTERLQAFLREQPGAQPVLALQSDVDATGIPFTLHGPTDIGAREFNAGSTNAQRYEVELDGRRIPIHVPVNLPAGSHTPEQIALGLAQLPRVCRDLITEVNINPGRNPDDERFERDLNQPGFRSYMTTNASGVINVFPMPDQPMDQGDVNGSLLHETGHILTQRAWGTDRSTPPWREYARAMEQDGISISQYARATPGEGFSEMLHLYQRVRGTPAEGEYRRQMPAQFAIVERMVGGG